MSQSTISGLPLGTYYRPEQAGSGRNVPARAPSRQLAINHRRLPPPRPGVFLSTNRAQRKNRRTQPVQMRIGSLAPSAVRRATCQTADLPAARTGVAIRRTAPVSI